MCFLRIFGNFLSTAGRLNILLHLHFPFVSCIIVGHTHQVSQRSDRDELWTPVQLGIVQPLQRRQGQYRLAQWRWIRTWQGAKYCISVPRRDKIFRNDDQRTCKDPLGYPAWFISIICFYVTSTLEKSKSSRTMYIARLNRIRATDIFSYWWWGYSNNTALWNLSLFGFILSILCVSLLQYGLTNCCQFNHSVLPFMIFSLHWINLGSKC